MPQTHINRFLFILQLLYVNSILYFYLFYFHRLPYIYSIATFLFIIPFLSLGILLTIISKYFKAYKAYRDLILLTIGISAGTLWIPMLLGLYTGPQEYGMVLKSKKAFNIEIKDVPENEDALWMTLKRGIIMYDLKSEYHEVNRFRQKESTTNDIYSYYTYPVVSNQWTPDAPILIFYCEKQKYNTEKKDSWSLPFLIESHSDYAKKGGLIIRDPNKIKLFSKSLMKTLRTKDIKISDYTVFIQPIKNFDAYYSTQRRNFYIFIILINILWVGITGIALWLNRKKTVQYVNFDFMQ